MKNILLCLMLATVATSSFAQSTNLTFKGMELSQPDVVTVTLNGNKDQVYAGALQFKTSTGDSLISYCADLSASLDSSSHSYTYSGTGTSNSSPIDIAGSILSDNFGLATTADEQAGLQLAVWSAIYNDGSIYTDQTGAFHLKGVNQGNFNSVESYAAQYYTSGYNFPNSAWYYQASSEDGQSQLAPEAVPSPSSFGFIAIGIAGLIARRRR